MSIVTPDQTSDPLDPREPALTDAAPVARPPVRGARRAEVLAWLTDSDTPRTATEVAAHTDLHLNTARFHLDALVASGHLVRRHEERGTPGRPRVLYSLSQDRSVRSYRLLAGMLTSLVRALGGNEEAAVSAGRAWGAELVADSAAASTAGAETADGPESLRRLDDLMERVGFQPESRAGDQPEVHLHHCPFIEVVDGNQDVVCALHRGLMQGALEQLGAPLQVQTLEPFATPETCVARLVQTSTPARSAR